MQMRRKKEGMASPASSQLTLVTPLNIIAPTTMSAKPVHLARVRLRVSGQWEGEVARLLHEHLVRGRVRVRVRVRVLLLVT